MAAVLGLTLCKINGIYVLDVRNARWSVRRAVPQHITGGGVKTAIGQEVPSGSFDEVIPKEKQFNWRALQQFAIQIYDKETRSIVVASFDGCDWTGLDGTTDLAGANTSKAITWNGAFVNKA